MKRNRKYDTYLYRFIRGNGGWSNWTYEVVKTAVGITILEQYKLKHHYIVKLKAQ